SCFRRRAHPLVAVALGAGLAGPGAADNGQPELCAEVGDSAVEPAGSRALVDLGDGVRLAVGEHGEDPLLLAHFIAAFRQSARQQLVLPLIVRTPARSRLQCEQSFTRALVHASPRAAPSRS